MNRLILLAAVLIAGCTTVHTTTDTDTRSGAAVAEGQELPAIPHPGEPCNALCRHYCFAGRWHAAHLHFDGCPHVLDPTLKRWTFR